MKKLAILPAALLLVLACGKKDDKKADDKKTDSAAKATDAKGGDSAKAGDTAKADDSKPAAAASGPLSLAKVDNLKLDVDPNAKVEDGIGGDGVMITLPSGVALSVGKESDTQPHTLDDAKKDNDMYSPVDLKGDKLADGWWLTFKNTGSMGDNYFVQVHHDIDGKPYRCETTVSTADQQAEGLAACKSLRK